MLKVIIDQIVKILRSKEKVDFTHLQKVESEIITPVITPSVVTDKEDPHLVAVQPTFYVESKTEKVGPTFKNYVTVSRRKRGRRLKQRGPR